MNTDIVVEPGPNETKEIIKTYERLEQYLYHELDASEIKSPALSEMDKAEVMKFVNSIASEKVIKRKNKPPDWNKLQKPFGFAPLGNCEENLGSDHSINKTCSRDRSL